ncbi:MAG: LPS assembly lipoprotein LptE [Deltaproteobacteria bacterium]|nr:LPS assembly lipoprotein LptE [Deltaproteobacteria bacterium]
MAFRAYFRLLLLPALVWALAGCGYQLTNSASDRLVTGQKIWVPFIGNESVSPTAQTVLRRALYDESHALRGLVAADSEASADLFIKGRLVSYSTKVVSYSAADRAREIRLTLDVELELYRRGEAAPLWKGMLQASKTYPTNDNLALQRNAEESALDSAARLIAGKFVSAVEQNF